MIYLKQFAIEKQNQGFVVQVFDVRAKRILKKPYSIAEICRDKFFYAAETGAQDEISQAFEDVFGRIETVIADALPGIIERAGALQLTNDDLDVLAYFMSVQWLRTPFFRERVQEIESETMKIFFEMQSSLPRFQDRLRRAFAAEGIEMSDEKQTEEVKRINQSGVLRLNNAVSLNLICEEKVNGFRGLLLAKKWRINLSEGPYHFITSDNPVATPRTERIPVTFMDRRHLLALTPNILIETCHPDSMNPEQQPVDRVSYHTANGKGVLMFNEVLAESAHEYAYASQRDELEQLLNLSRSRGALSPAGP